MNDSGHTGVVRVFGPETESHMISADVLSRTVMGLQQVTYVLAATKDGADLRSKFRPTDALRAKYTIKVGALKANCLSVPFELVDTRSQPDLDLGKTFDWILNGIHLTYKAVSIGQLDLLAEITDDPRWRDRLASDVLKSTPRVGERWRLGISTKQSGEVVVGHKEVARFEQVISSSEEEATTMTVTGKLIKVDFESRQLWIKHPLTSRQIECSYMSDIEEQLLDARRDYVQVTGVFTLDSEGNPIKLSDVSKVEPIDLSSLRIDCVSSGDTYLVIEPSLILDPELDDTSKQLLVVKEPELNLHVFAHTRKQLLQEVEECVMYLWQSFVEDDTESLSVDATELRDKLMRRITRK